MEAIFPCRGNAIRRDGIIADAALVAPQAFAIAVKDGDDRLKRRGDTRRHDIERHDIALFGGKNEIVLVAFPGDLAVDDDRERNSLGSLELRIRLAFDE